MKILNLFWGEKETRTYNKYGFEFFPNNKILNFYMFFEKKLK